MSLDLEKISFIECISPRDAMRIHVPMSRTKHMLWKLKTSSPRSDYSSGTRLIWAHLLLMLLEYVSNFRKTIIDSISPQNAMRVHVSFFRTNICCGYSKELSQ